VTCCGFPRAARFEQLKLRHSQLLYGDVKRAGLLEHLEKLEHGMGLS
jgi:hypothetical protein